jgi:hypothetical protein
MSGYRETQKQCAEAQAEDGNIDKICGLNLALVIILILFSYFLFLIGTFATCLWIYDTVTEPPRVMMG